MTQKVFRVALKCLSYTGKQDPKNMTSDIYREKAIFVGVIKQNDDERQVNEYLDELEFLAETAGAEGTKRFIQKVDKPDPRTYIRSGKLDEIKEYITENETDVIIFDDELTPTQLRNIERELNIRILDRTNLILDIFAQRAKTAYAKTQVELAQYQYLLPRLTRMWTHLERQKGGIGMRGPGETQIETDRRIIQDKDRPPYHPGQDCQTEGATEEDRQADGVTTRQQRFPCTHITCRLHKCRQKHTYEPACKK